MNYNWVKQEVSSKEWGNYYSNIAGYCLLGDGYMGFLVSSDYYGDCEPCDEEEIRQMDMYRRANNIRPYPLLDDEPQNIFDDKKGEEEREEMEREFKKIKDEFPDIFKNAEE